MKDNNQCKHETIASCPFPSVEYCSYGKCPGVGDDKIIDFVVTCNRTFIECENHDLVWDTISKCKIGDTIKVHSPTGKNCSVFSPFNSLTDKIVSIDSDTLNWLEQYTWIMEDGSYDFHTPRRRPSDLLLNNGEMAMVATRKEIENESDEEKNTSNN